MSIDKIVEQYNSGDILLEDAIIELRSIKAEMEAKIDSIKAFEKANLNEIGNLANEYKDGYKGMRFKVMSKTSFDFKNIPQVIELTSKIKEVEENVKPIAQALVAGKVGVEVFSVKDGMIGDEETDLVDGDYAYDANGEAVMLPIIKYGEPYLMVEKIKEKKK